MRSYRLGVLSDLPGGGVRTLRLREARYAAKLLFGLPKKRLGVLARLIHKAGHLTYARLMSSVRDLYDFRCTDL